MKKYSPTFGTPEFTQSTKIADLILERRRAQNTVTTFEGGLIAARVALADVECQILHERAVLRAMRGIK
jgi:hypothetical protein